MRFKNAIVLFVFSAFVSCGAQSNAPENQSSAHDYSKEAYVVEHLSTKVIVEEDGSDVREVAAEVKVLADAGVKALAVLNFTFTSANQVVDVDYVRVRKLDGTVVKTPDYNVQDMPADITRSAPMYSDVREKHVAVKGLGVGDVLEYKIRFRTVKPQVPGQFWYEHSFSKSEIVRDERLELTVPKGKHLSVKSPDFKPEIREQGASIIYIWQYSCLARENKDEEAPSPLRGLPPPSIQISTFSSWQEVGRWYSELQKDQIAVTPAIAAKANELTRNLATDDEKLYAIYRFVSANIHYVGLDFGIGRFQPHAAEDVLSNEYGDCKDKHTLLAALLKAAGYEAWPALIHVSRKLDSEVPSLAQFNHVITVVPRGGKLVWLDTTPEVAPYGLLLAMLRDKQALVMPSGKDAMLLTTPANAPFPQVQRFTVTAKLGADGVLKGHIEQKYHGDTEVVFRTALRRTSQSNWKELMQRVSQSLGFGGEVSNVVSSPLEDLTQPLEFSYDYLRKDYADWENRQILAALPPFGIESAANKNQKVPKDPLYLGAPGELLYHSEIELPAGSSLTAPKDLDLVEPYLEYHSVNKLENGVLKTTRRMNVKMAEVPVSEWEVYSKLAKTVSDDEFNYLKLAGLQAGSSAQQEGAGDTDRKFKEGVEALQKRDSKRAQELFEQVIAANPRYRGAHFNLGVALVSENRLEDALAEFRKEEEISPDETGAVQAAARLAMLLHRKEDAIQEWRRLLKVDPKNHDAALALGQLLLADGKYAEAAESLEAAVQLSPDSTGLQFQLGEAYIKSGSLEKALPHLRIAANDDNNTKTIDVMTLNNVAYTLAEANAEPDLAKRYAEKALVELDVRSHADSNHSNHELARDFAMLWDTAGWVYFQSGDCNRAESYIRASWLLDQQSVVGEHLGQVYEKLGKDREAAHTYELAFAAIPGVVGMSASSQFSITKENDETRKRIADRYQKLTGKTLAEPSLYARPMKRLPSGQWPVTTGEELSQLRDTKFSHQSGPYGSAEFDLTFTPGKAPVAVFASGDAKMKEVFARLEAAKFQVEFPVGSNAILVRHATVYCGQYAPCDAVLTPLE
jgi:tetratricopeptide (TPR) repeat protein